MMIQEKLVEYINSKGIKHGVIAEACGISQYAMSRSMNFTRRLTLGEFSSICNFLGVSMDYFNEVDDD